MYIIAIYKGIYGNTTLYKNGGKFFVKWQRIGENPKDGKLDEISVDDAKKNYFIN